MYRNYIPNVNNQQSVKPYQCILIDRYILVGTFLAIPDYMCGNENV